VSYDRTHSTNSQPFWDWGAEEKGTEKKKGDVSEEVSLVMIQPFAWEKKRVL